MCGLYTMLLPKKNRISIDQFMEINRYIFPELVDRGGSFNNTDGAGYFHPAIGVVKGNYTGKELVKLPEFEEISKHPVPKVFMGHVRKSVKGSSDKNENNHPLWSENYIVIHNGTTYSDLEESVLKDELNLPGEVDTRHILASLEKYGEKEWLSHLKGTGAIIVLNRKNSNLLIYKDNKPIFYMRYKGIWISSTVNSLKEIARILGVNKKNLFPPAIYEYENGNLYQLKIKNERIDSFYLCHKLLLAIPNNINNINNVYNYPTTTFISEKKIEIKETSKEEEEKEKLIEQKSLQIYQSVFQTEKILTKEELEKRFHKLEHITLCPKCLTLFPTNMKESKIFTRSFCILCNGKTDLKNYDELYILNFAELYPWDNAYLHEIILKYVKNPNLKEIMIKFTGGINIVKTPINTFFYMNNVTYRKNYYQTPILDEFGNLTSSNRLVPIINGKYIGNNTITIINNIPRFRVPTILCTSEIRDAFIEFRDQFLIMASECTQKKISPEI